MPADPTAERTERADSAKDLARLEARLARTWSSAELLQTPVGEVAARFGVAEELADAALDSLLGAQRRQQKPTFAHAELELAGARIELITSAQDCAQRDVARLAQRLRLDGALVAAALSRLTGRRFDAPPTPTRPTPEPEPSGPLGPDIARLASRLLLHSPREDLAAIAPLELATAVGADVEAVERALGALGLAREVDRRRVLREAQPKRRPRKPAAPRRRAQPVPEPAPARGAAPCPLILARIPFTSDTDRAGPLDHVDLHGRLTLSAPLRLLHARIAMAICQAAVRGTEPRFAHREVRLNLSELERRVCLRRYMSEGPRRRPRDRSLTGGGAGRRLRRALEDLATVAVSAEAGKKDRRWRWDGGTLLAAVSIELPDGERVSLREWERRGHAAIAAGRPDPRHRAGRGAHLVVELSDALLAQLRGDAFVWADLDAAATLTSALDLNVLLLLQSQVPRRGEREGWHTPGGQPCQTRAIYFPDRASTADAQRTRALFNMVGVFDGDLRRAGQQLVDAARTVAERCPAWGSVWTTRHKTNGMTWLCVEAREGVRDRRCPPRLRGHAAPSRTAWRRRASASARRDGGRAGVRALLARELAARPPDR